MYSKSVARSVILTFALIQIVAVNGDGKLSYGDKCSVQNAIIRVFTNAEVSDSEKCSGNQGLICTGTCTCPPTRVWDKGVLFGLFGGGRCIVGANGPCAKDDQCVAHAACGESLPLCFCNEGYHAHDLQCISSQKIFSSGAETINFAVFTMFVSLVVSLILQ